MYETGEYLRTRYDGYIGDDYKPKELYVISSDLDRTIMSAQLVMVGMFPTQNGTSWNPHLPWQPIPIRTLPYHEDNVRNPVSLVLLMLTKPPV